MSRLFEAVWGECCPGLSGWGGDALWMRAEEGGCGGGGGRSRYAEYWCAEEGLGLSVVRESVV